MTAYTSTKAGNWSDSTVWSPAGVPGAGDTAQQIHAITMDVSKTIGVQGPGAPVGSSNTPALSSVAGGGSLPGGTYRVCYTLVDVSGNESGPSPEQTFALTAGNTLRVTFPALPSGAASRKLYLSAAGGGNWAETMYASGITTTTYDCTSASWTNGTTLQSAATSVKTTFAIYSAAGLTVATGVTLTQHGEIGLNNSALTFNAGSSWNPDPPSGQSYRLWNQIVYGGTGGTVAFNGSLGSPVTISVTSGATAAIEPMWSGNVGVYCANNGALTMTYCNVTRLGSSSQPCIRIATSLSVQYTFQNCLFDSCGEINIPSADRVDLFQTTFVRSVGTKCINCNGSVALTAGTRRLSQCVTDILADFNQRAATIEDNFFLGGIDWTSRGANLVGSFARNFIRWGLVNSQIPRCGDWTECVFIVDGSTFDGLGRYSATANLANPHWTTPAGPTNLYTTSYCIFESFGSDGAGDVDYGPNSTGLDSYWHHNIGLPEPVGAIPATGRTDDPGTMTTFNGWSGAASKYEHNTWAAGNQGAVALNEASGSGVGYAGQLASFKSNLIFSHSYWTDKSLLSAGGVHFGPLFAYSVGHYSAVASDVNDMILVSGGVSQADYNWGFNTAPGAGGNTGTTTQAFNGYQVRASVTPGTHDQFGDPQFVDWTRNFSTWVASIEATWGAAPSGAYPSNGAPSRTDYNAHGLYKFSLTNQTSHADYDSRYTLAAYKAYIRAGFTPRNTALKGTAHDGTDRGAVAVQAPSAVFRRTYSQLGTRTGSRQVA